ncbi:hypothetical protein MmiAt1_10630 [Methanimicrococcus sp. At1]|uniref:Macro domain-containing protein n=1 Tax=Methanimicrococcus hacksteinii TaxID=3028293 RepID=A0ABU3VPZ7_9EURY|nr:macro domain-containing protein [Methanimicrococcus sp. At1]MDV0445483.1 hypothetical protein [Methanimicrococcus sp. At1]
MIQYTTGNILESDADFLVNTVNCEGYMGKGIAYQFKLQYPENNNDYVKACRNGSLHIGTLHYFEENGKMIINFPTKDKWRENSRIEFIESGLKELVILIQKLNIKSIAIPPLGSGNGGLNWNDVKIVIEKYLSDIDSDIFIYEPSQNYVSQPKAAPNLSASALVIIKIREQLKSQSAFRLQKTAYFVNIFSQTNYFNFSRNKYGPYANSINIIDKNINEFKNYYRSKDLKETYDIAYTKLISKNVDEKLLFLSPFIEKAAVYTNNISDDHKLEGLSTILYLLQENGTLTEDEIILEFKNWSDAKSKSFNETEIKNGIDYLIQTKVIQMNLVGYCLSNMKSKK